MMDIFLIAAFFIAGFSGTNTLLSAFDDRISNKFRVVSVIGGSITLIAALAGMIFIVGSL
jgi:hypothetical protein